MAVHLRLTRQGAKKAPFYRVVAADSGAMGGNTSAEFQILAETGEDAIVVCPSCEYAANVEAAVAKFGRIDVLANNAGNFFAGFFEELRNVQKTTCGNSLLDWENAGIPLISFRKLFLKPS